MEGSSFEVMSTTDNSATDDHELPVFPAEAPPTFDDPTTAAALLAPVLDNLAKVVVVPDDGLDKPTPCEEFTVAELRHHVLGWLQFFAAALSDPAGRIERLDPATWSMGTDDDPTAIVRAASTRLLAAVDDGVGDHLVVMSQARMKGSAVMAMALGEYIVHGWDLATATGRPWDVADAAADQARLFLEGTVSPEYRGPDSGFFDAEIEVADDASALDRLLGFAGRNPQWSP